MSISTFISSYIKYISRYRIFFLSLAQKGINPKCQLRKFENKRVNGKNVQINTQHDVAMSLFPSRRLCCFGFCMYLFSRFKGSRFQSTLNGKTRNQPADEKEQGIEWDENNNNNHASNGTGNRQ